MLKTEQALKPRTGNPAKYPQGYFRDKTCACGNTFAPQAPSQKHCGPECAQKAQRDAYYRRTYGIGVQEWMCLYDAQHGLCAVCHTEGFTMRDAHEAKLMVDHDHQTGAVRGLLCHNCNRALGLLQDSKANIQRALEYLERATTIPQGSRAKQPEAHSPDTSGEDIVCSA